MISTNDKCVHAPDTKFLSRIVTILNRMEPTKKRNYECDTAGYFSKEEQQPDPRVVSNLAMHFPELPEWMVSAAVMFDQKNPGWRSSHDRKKGEVLKPFQVPDEWWGETPEEREAKGGHAQRTQEEALAYANDPMKDKVSSEHICQPHAIDQNKIEEIVSVV